MLRPDVLEQLERFHARTVDEQRDVRACTWADVDERYRAAFAALPDRMPDEERERRARLERIRLAAIRAGHVR